MKFGGTSVQDAAAISRVADIVRSRVARKPVVVVSAMSKVTDALIAAATAASTGDRKNSIDIAQRLRERHLQAASTLLTSSDELQRTSCFLMREFDALEDLLRGISAVGELTARTLDNVVSNGERMSSHMVAAAFRSRDLPSEYVDARRCVITDDTYGKAIPDFAATEQALKRQVSPWLQGDKVVVMGGFIGGTMDGVTTTLGRGGSDFTGAIVGASMGAKDIEIWTDVDGMMTTDPRLCPQARRIRSISFEEAAELAYFGAKVLHPATLLPAVQKNIPVWVLNSQNPSCEGTKIVARAPHTRNPFKAIAAKKSITIVDVVATRMLMAHGFLESIFAVFARHRCPVDMVSTSEVSVSLTVDSNQAIPVIAADLEKLADVKYEGRKAIVCMVGENIRGTRGIAAKVFGAIPDVDIRMISQGASEINISFVIEERDVATAVNALHETFFTDVDPEVFA
jgi:aspartate kinase